MSDLDPVLQELAAAFDIATEFWDWQGHYVPVQAETIIPVLAALGVDATSPGGCAGQPHRTAVGAVAADAARLVW